jgi:hypothetical protein
MAANWAYSSDRVQSPCAGLGSERESFRRSVSECDFWRLVFDVLAAVPIHTRLRARHLETLKVRSFSFGYRR